VEILQAAELLTQLRDQVEAPIAELIAAADRGRLFREGAAVVILGRPNVGKSSLLNMLLREERAIVTSLPGTTRDTIEEHLDIQGIPVRIVDTAGIREPTEPIEEIGIRRAQQKVAAADLILLLLDGSVPPTAADRQLLASLADKPRLLVLNKIDITPEAQIAAYHQAFPDSSLIPISAATGEGIEAMEKAICTILAGDMPGEADHACVPNLRHRASLARALAATRAAAAGLANGLPSDLLAIELQTALDQLGEIIGETTVEDVLDTIFERFCIGK
jgi:tRNA modification GTPase